MITLSSTIVAEKENRLRATQIGDQRSAIKDQIAVYIHVPFCQQRCSYCDFNIYAGMHSLYVPYAQAVAEEIAVTAARVGRVSAPSIYIGGGTPSLLPAELIGGLLSTVRAFFDVAEKAEVTMEVNPKGKRQAAGGKEYFMQLHALGVNRISLGVQSSHEDELHLLRRWHSFQDAVDTYKVARQAGFDNVNVDVIYGLPGQPIEKWRATLERVIDLEPDHVSAYSLQVEERTAMFKWVRQGRVPTPNDEVVAAMYELTEEMLAEAGFEHYEISNWAKARSRDGETERKREGFRSRHNLVYWHNEPYFGFGCGAHSSFNGKRYSNVLHPREYIQRIEQTGEAVIEAEEINRALEMGETMILGLRLIEEGIERATLKDRFGVELDEIYGPTIAQLIEQGLLESNAERIRLTARGRLLGNRVFVEFLPVKHAEQSSRGSSTLRG